MNILVAALAAWAVWMFAGAVVALVMRRRGYGLAGWFVLGVLLGPLVIFLTADVAEHRRRTGARVLEAGVREPGAVDVLVGIDDTAGSRLALHSALDVLGANVGRLTLATVLDYDTAASPESWSGDDQAIARLESIAAELGDRRPALVLLAGDAADQLPAYACAQRFDLLVVGPRTGLSKVFVGSVVAELSRGAPLPIWIGPRPDATPAVHGDHDLHWESHDALGGSS